MDEHGIENHPDLMDPDWQRHAEKEAWIDARRNRRRAKRGRRLAVFALVLVVVAGAGVVFYRWGKATSDHYAGGSSPASTTTTTTAAATTTPTDLPDLARVDLSRPFDNTPAQNWAEGIAGLTVPAAAKVGAFSAQQVSSALDQVKQAIAVAHFDSGTLVGHSPQKYLALLAPDARGQAGAQVADYVTYLADGFHLLPVQPRMTGGLTVRPGNTGELLVHANYVLAYAFDPGSEEIFGPGDIEPFIRVDEDYVLRSGSNWEKGSRGLWPADGQSYYTGAACGPLDQGRVAPAYSDQQVATTSAPYVPGQFDPAQPMPTVDTCH